MSHSLIVKVLICSMAIVVPLLFSGCGGSGLSRYDISGKVTYQGKPLPRGSISFDPLETNAEGGGFTEVVDGVYDTRLNGRGHLGGKHKVIITGSSTELVNPNDIDSGTKSLFEPFEFEADLPTSSSSQDFTVAP